MTKNKQTKNISFAKACAVSFFLSSFDFPSELFKTWSGECESKISAKVLQNAPTYAGNFRKLYFAGFVFSFCKSLCLKFWPSSKDISF